MEPSEVHTQAGVYRRKNGSTLPVEVHLTQVDIDTAGCKPLNNFATPGCRILLRSYSRQYEGTTQSFTIARERDGA